MEKQESAQKQLIDPEKIVGFKFPPFCTSWNEKDVILYALSIGACQNPHDPVKLVVKKPDMEKEFKYVYENHDQFSVLPSFAVIPTSAILYQLFQIPGLEFDPMQVLHGEHEIELMRPLPTSANVQHYARVEALEDKKTGSLFVLKVESKDEHSQETLFLNRYSLFIRGMRCTEIPSTRIISKPRHPRFESQTIVATQKTLPSQALLYRLNGDRNPLHADPSMSRLASFRVPILHGLCSFGFAVRMVLSNICTNGDDTTNLFQVSNVKKLRARFASPVYPGETLSTEILVHKNRVYFQARVVERDVVVIKGGLVEFSQAGTTYIGSKL